MADIEPGSEGSAHLRVSQNDTAPSFRSGDVPVLATPRLVALCEEATVAAVAFGLDPTETTVGVRVVLDHTRATGVGAQVTAHAANCRSCRSPHRFRSGRLRREG